MASTFHHYSPRFTHHNSFLSWNPCSSSSSSFDRSRGFLWNFVTFSGINSFWKNGSLRAQVVSSTTRSGFSPTCYMDVEDKPEHLLVLVHGILASPSDWTYAQAELKRRLGRKFLIYGAKKYISSFRRDGQVISATCFPLFVFVVGRGGLNFIAGDSLLIMQYSLWSASTDLDRKLTLRYSLYSNIVNPEGGKTLAGFPPTHSLKIYKNRKKCNWIKTFFSFSTLELLVKWRGRPSDFNIGEYGFFFMK